jgi:Flp pilus assembly protein TadD
MKKLLQRVWRVVKGQDPATTGATSRLPANAGQDEAARLTPELVFEEALAAQQVGRLAEAQVAYKRILQHHPKHAPALHFLGVSHGQAGDLVEAERLIRQSIKLDEVPEFFSNLAFVLDRQDRAENAASAYRDGLKLAPGNASMLRNLGDLLLRLARHSEAEPVYRDLLALQSDDAELHFRLGLVLAELKQTDAAVIAYRQAVSLNPGYADAWNNLGNLLQSLDRDAEAEEAYRDALLQRPDDPAIQCNLGQLLQKIGRHAEAAMAYRRAVALKADYAEAWIHLGSSLLDAEQYAEAEIAYRKVLSLSPDNVALHTRLGNLLRKTNRSKDAEMSYRRALDLQPDCAEACSNLASLLQGDGHMAEAETLHRRALELQPGSALAHYNFGCLMLENRNLAEAGQAFSRVLELQPDVAEAHDGLGTVYRDSAHYAEAETAYRCALALKPGTPGTHVNLGSVLQATERFDEAEAAYRQALALEAEHDLAHYNLALLHLARKQLRSGWEGYERRWKLKGFNLPRHRFPQLPWCGESLAGECILLWQEQGIGDTVLYAGMAHDLLAQGARLIIECEARLVPLFRRSFPQAQVVMSSHPPHVVTREARWQSPFGSLCRWLRTQLDAFIWRGPYLIPDQQRVLAFRQRYRALGSGPVIGVSWRSGNYKVGIQKSLSLEELAPLLRLPGAVFVNLQYGDCAVDLARLKSEIGLTVHHDDSLDPLKDLDGFAAQVAAMDLVISTSNSTVHFAGAMDIPVWMLLPRGGSALLWYWFTEGDRSPWYPGMRIFRQDAPGDWSGSLAQTAKALQAFITERNR